MMPSFPESAVDVNLKQKLRDVVKSIRWTYSIFWKRSHLLLVWNDGYYNGDIKKSETGQLPIEELTATMERSVQLRELFEYLSTGGDENAINKFQRKSAAALRPEDLTDPEWFYLLSMSYTFQLPDLGLPGRALAEGDTFWLFKAHEANSNFFSRALLAKSASIQTVVYIPFNDGVLELGVTDLVHEDLALVQHIKSFFDKHVNPIHIVSFIRRSIFYSKLLHIPSKESNQQSLQVTGYDSDHN